MSNNLPLSDSDDIDNGSPNNFSFCRNSINSTCLRSNRNGVVDDLFIYLLCGSIGHDYVPAADTGNNRVGAVSGHGRRRRIAPGVDIGYGEFSFAHLITLVMIANYLISDMDGAGRYWVNSFDRAETLRKVY